MEQQFQIQLHVFVRNGPRKLRPAELRQAFTRQVKTADGLEIEYAPGVIREHRKRQKAAVTL